MNRVNIQPQAEIDLEEASGWYESQLIGLGTDFLLEAGAAIEKAAESPELYAKQH